MRFTAIFLLLCNSIWAVPSGGDFLVTSQTNEQDLGANGTIDSRFTTTNTYGSHGELLRRTERSEFDEIENYARTLVYTDSPIGFLLAMIETDSDGDGLIDLRTTFSHTFADRVLTATRTLVDRGADGTVDEIDLRTTFSHTFADRVLTVTQTLVDRGADGTVDEIDTETSTSDKGLQTSVVEFDTNADGTSDSRSINTWSYDSRRRELADVSEADHDANGTVDSRARLTWTFDNRRNQILYLGEEDNNADGKPDLISSLRDAYDDQNRHVSSISEVDFDGDGVIDESETTIFFYDDHGKLALSSSSTSEARTVFGNFTSAWFTTYAYDNDGNLLRSVTDETVDIGMFGVFKNRYIQTFSYVRRNRVLRDPSDATRPAIAPAIPTFVTGGLDVLSQVLRPHVSAPRWAPGGQKPVSPNVPLRAKTGPPDGVWLKATPDNASVVYHN